MIDRNEIAKTAFTHQNKEYVYTEFEVNGITIEVVFNEYERTELSIYIFNKLSYIGKFTWKILDLPNNDYSIVIDELDRKLLMRDLDISYEETIEVVATLLDYLQDEMSYSWGKTISQAIAASSLR